VANLSLGDNLLVSGPTWTDLKNNEYTVGSYGNATIIVGAGTCPTPTPNPTFCASCPVGGIVALPVSGSGSGATALLVALVSVAALAVMTVGVWHGRRRWRE
jgi:hypothetical protein